MPWFFHPEAFDQATSRLWRMPQAGYDAALLRLNKCKQSCPYGYNSVHQMTINLQRLVDSSFGINLVSALGRWLPTRLGYNLADFVAARIAAQRDSGLVRAVRANQWVIQGEALEGVDLDQAVLETFQHSARSIFDLYHYMRDPELARRPIVLDATTRMLLQRPEFDDCGLMIVGLHMSGFDLVLQSLCQLGLRVMVLTLPSPQGGRQMEFEMRRRIKMNLVPVSVPALRQALRHLSQGGVVLTGIDRPTVETGARLSFFGRPAALPAQHVFLAAKAQVPIKIMVSNRLPDGKYHIFTSDPIEMEYHQDREKGMIINAERVLSVAEGFIRQAPRQWSMSLPVWPETLAVVPD